MKTRKSRDLIITKKPLASSQQNYTFNICEKPYGFGLLSLTVSFKFAKKYSTNRKLLSFANSVYGEHSINVMDRFPARMISVRDVH